MVCVGSIKTFSPNGSLQPGFAYRLIGHSPQAECGRGDIYKNNGMVRYNRQGRSLTAAAYPGFRLGKLRRASTMSGNQTRCYLNSREVFYLGTIMAKPFYVYILKCGDGSYYTGHTDDLEKRLLEHQNVIENCYTAIRQPLELVFYEVQQTREDAVKIEAQIKRWSRNKKEALIKRDGAQLSSCAKKCFDKEMRCL